MSSSEKRVKKPTVTERLAGFVMRHSALATVGTALLVCGILVAVFWFTIFSGLSTSADFVYAKF